MTRRMLINAQKPEELRIAIVSGKTLDSYQVDVAEKGLTRGNIYRGVIANIQPSLNAAFVDYGAERHGFLAIQDVVPEAYYNKPKGNGRTKIEDVLERGKPIVVQVVKEPEGNKGAALTTNLSLAGRYLVLTPFSKTRGVSRKVEEDDVRKALKKQATKLEIPDGSGVIVRTNALDQNKTALSRDLNALLRLWKRVGTEARDGAVGGRKKKKGSKGGGAKLVYSDQDLILQALRDHMESSIREVVVDDDRAFSKVEEYMRAFMPRSRTKLVRYSDRAPLFSHFEVESQVDRIYDRKVDLPSGGSIVIDRAEALTAIDVNSGRATGAASQAETALNTNVEAAREVGRQLRLRDIGGLVVVDFIDMRNRKHQAKVEKVLRDSMKVDKARFKVGRTSPNGLVEINRQRIQQALHLRTHRACPTCEGTGHIASAEMVSLNLLRRIEARAATGVLKKVRVELHPEVSDAFQNGRRQQIAALEREFGLKIEVVASSHLHRPEEQIDWIVGKRRTEPAAVAAVSANGGDAHPQGASLHASMLAMPEDDEQDSKSGQEAAEKRPRRRRRSRRKSGTGTKPSEAQGESAGKAEEASAEAAKKPARAGRSRSKKAVSGAKKKASGEGAEVSETASRPTRSRTRRRVRDKTTSEPVFAKLDEAGPAVPPIPPASPAPETDAAEPEAKARPARRRVVRRRKPAAKKTPAAQGDAGGAAEPSPTAEAPSDSTADATPRRRRRTRRRAPLAAAAPAED